MLSPAHALFVQARIKGATLEAAARAAGFKGTPKVLKKRGFALTQREDVQAELQRLQAQANTKAVMARERALEILTLRAEAIAAHNIAEFIKFEKIERFDEANNLKTVEYIPTIDLEKAARAKALGAVEALEIIPEEITTYGSGDREHTTVKPLRVKVKLADPNATLANLAKLCGWAEPEKLELSGKVDVNPAQLSDDELADQLRTQLQRLEGHNGKG